MKKIQAVFILLLILLVGIVYIFFLRKGIYSSNNIKDREYFGAKFEPRHHVIHGAGQSQKAFKEYAAALDTSTSPLIYMLYHGVRSKGHEWLYEKIKRIEDINWYVIPQIGLSMTQDGEPEKHYEHLVAQGKYDNELDSLVYTLGSLERPVYLRIGYEFNGPWNGYFPETYKKAFIKVYESIKRMQADNIATVWCFCPDPRTPDFMQYYPGDQYVDWWCIDFFSPEHLRFQQSHDFLDSAGKHRKPVMIGESTPRYVGVHNGDSSWMKWYKPYFNIIHQYPQIKAFCYINWNWAEYDHWHDWGDARIQENEIVRSKYYNEMNRPLYLHAREKDEINKLINYK